MLNYPIIFEKEKERMEKQILRLMVDGKTNEAKELLKYLREYEKRMMKVMLTMQ